MNFKEKMEKLQCEIEQKKDEIRKIVSEEIMIEFQKLFDEHTELENFSWVQYTDYFNDGDPCCFGVYAEEHGLDINGVRYDDCHYSEKSETLTEEEWDKFEKKISSIIYSIDSDTLESIFGDHVRVCVDRKGITTESYTNHN